LEKQLRIIMALQKIDTEIARTNNRKKLLPGELAKLDQSFHDFFAGYEKDQKVLEELNQAHREREEKFRRGVDSLKKAKERLSEVKTNKEYQAMLKEIEATETKNSSLEDEILVIMDQLEQARKKFLVRDAELEACRRDYELKKQAIGRELAAVDESIAAHMERQRLLREQIEPGLLKKYEAIKARSHGLAVVAAWHEICEGCHMNIPPQLYIDLQKDVDMKYCPHCNRIIYWEDRSEKDR
jgi:hypothetical protein